MAIVTESKHDLLAGDGEKSMLESAKSSIPISGIEVTRLENEPSDEPVPDPSTHSTYHIYSKHEVHKSITPTIHPPKERRSGPTIKDQKAHRKEKQARKEAGLPSVPPNDAAFFLHRPYLAFHMPPLVLYTGSSKHNSTPAVLIHQPCTWRKYKLQLGPALARPGVLDPRGVVSWAHNGGDKAALKHDDRALKGYKVRGWRLWGETGKEYVHSVRASRAAHGAGAVADPDVEKTWANNVTARADDVVYLRWTSPLSRHTRRYHFRYLDLDFYWKGTGTVKESRSCGFFLRFNHLKLVVALPLDVDADADIDTDTEKAKVKDKDRKGREVCLAKFTSSVASKKSGTLDMYDAAILRVVEKYAPELLERELFGNMKGITGLREEDVDERIVRLKKTSLYHVIVATATCMIMSEKEKRHTLMDLIAHGGEAGGGGG